MQCWKKSQRGFFTILFLVQNTFLLLYVTLWQSRINRKQGRKQSLKLFTGGCCLWQTPWDSCESHGQCQAAHGTRFRIKPAHFSDPWRPPGLTTRDRWSIAMAPVWGQNLHVGEPSTCQAFIWAPCNVPWERLCQRNSDDRNLGLWLEDSFEPGMVTLTYDLGTDLDGMELFQWVVCWAWEAWLGERMASVSLAQCSLLQHFFCH